MVKSTEFHITGIVNPQPLFAGAGRGPPGAIKIKMEIKASLIYMQMNKVT